MDWWILAGVPVSSFVVALSGALMPGPLLTVTVGEATRRGFWAGPLIILGHGLLELTLVLLLLAQGAGAEEMYNDIHPRYERWLKMFGFNENFVVRALGVREAGAVKDRPETLEQSEKLARDLAG